MMTAIHFHEAHLMTMLAQARQFDQGDIEIMGLQGMSAVDRTWSRTLLVSNRPIACMGLVHLWPGVAEAWVLTPANAAEHRFAIHRFVKRELWPFADRHGISRIQAAVREDFNVGQRWAERLGFQQEGYMKRFGPDGSDYFRYAWVRGVH